MAVTTTGRISKTAGVCGGDACIHGHRIPVWVLVAYQRTGATDADLLTYYPQLTAADLAAAWEYAAAHRDEVEHAIAENEAGDEGEVE